MSTRSHRHSILRSVWGRRHPSNQRRVTILTYHAVSERADPHSVSPGSFRRHMEFIQNRYQIISLTDVSLFLDDAAANGHRLVVTFDDGYRDFLENAYPVLDALRIPCTMFVPTGLLGRFNTWDVETGQAPRRPIMTSDEVRRLDLTSRVEIGSHTVSHIRMSQQTPEMMRREAVESKLRLEDLLGRSVTAFAYPYGQLDDYSRQTRRVLNDAGYTSAVSTHWGSNDPSQDRLALKRIWMREDDGPEDLAAKIDGFDDWRGAKERAGYLLRGMRRAIMPRTPRRAGA